MTFSRPLPIIKAPSACIVVQLSSTVHCITPPNGVQMADNLIQKKGESTWYVRLAVPADVQSKLKTKVLVQSLKTGLRREAMERRLPILTEWKQRIRTAREGIPLPDGWQDNVISLNDEIGQIFQNLKLGLVGVEAPPPPEVDPVIEARMRNNPKLVAAFQEFAQEHLKTG